MSNGEFDHLKQHIREVPDFPKAGINFYDITTLLNTPDALAEVVDVFYERYKDKDLAHVVAIESRGFIFGGALAYRLGVGFIPSRKPGKLPAAVERVEYQLEYGTDSLEMHQDAIQKGERVLLIDDLIATGGTAAGTLELLERLGGDVIECAFLIELAALGGTDRLKPVPSFSLLSYE